MEISRIDAIKILDKATDKDDPYWDNVTDDWYDEKNDNWPTIFDVFIALGITAEEFKEATGMDYPK